MTKLDIVSPVPNFPDDEPSTKPDIRKSRIQKKRMKMITKIKSVLNLIPHWVLVVLAAGTGAAWSYFQQNISISELSSWSTLWPVLVHALLAGATMIIGLLRKEPWAQTAAKVTMIVGLCFIIGCLSSAPIIPVTSQNQAQVTSCENTASLHDGVIIGDFVVGGTTAGLASVGAAVNDNNTKTTLGIVSAVTAAVGVVGAGIAELTASNFQNSNCSSVVGPLPTFSVSAQDGGK